ncbi:MAG: hypothetical protein ACRDLS_02475 [Solirubrobacteraceae bacterium]
MTAVALAGGCGDDGPSIAPEAEQSVARLPPRQESAGQALVRLEAAARARDGRALCRTVYDFSDAGGPSGECERGMRSLYPTANGTSIIVRSVQMHGLNDATATADVLVLDRGAEETHSVQRFTLVRRGGTWRVVFFT